jgi:hypothetical protein
MDVTVIADPGQVAPFGEATIHGPQTFDHAKRRAGNGPVAVYVSIGQSF